MCHACSSNSLHVLPNISRARYKNWYSLNCCQDVSHPLSRHVRGITERVEKGLVSVDRDSQQVEYIGPKREALQLSDPPTVPSQWIFTTSAKPFRGRWNISSCPTMRNVHFYLTTYLYVEFIKYASSQNVCFYLFALWSNDDKVAPWECDKESLKGSFQY